LNLITVVRDNIVFDALVLSVLITQFCTRGKFAVPPALTNSLPLWTQIYKKGNSKIHKLSKKKKIAHDGKAAIQDISLCQEPKP
jgi:hypothetical protein